MSDTLNFVHRYVPPTGDDDVTLLLLHGTGGDENDLIPLGQALRPGAGMLSPRGKVLEHGMPRFFRRLAEGVFDMEDLALRTAELSAFITLAAQQYGFDSSRLVAVGFSNGANIAGSIVLTQPHVIPRGVLLSPMLPFEPKAAPTLEGDSFFIGAGRNDPIAPTQSVERLDEILRASGADVELYWQNGGHTITKDELEAARRWLSN